MGLELGQEDLGLGRFTGTIAAGKVDEAGSVVELSGRC
jgi:hypothetical protein